MFLYPNENLPSFSSFLRSVFFCPNALLFYLLLDHCLIRLSTVFLAFTSPPDSSDRPSLFLRPLDALLSRFSLELSPSFHCTIIIPSLRLYPLLFSSWTQLLITIDTL